MTKNKHLTTNGNDTTGRLLGDVISGTVENRRGTAGHSVKPSPQDPIGHSSRRPTYVSVRQAAWLLGVPASVIHRAIRVGTLPAVHRRSRLVVTERDVQRLMLGGAS
jgi:hypothetical protein